MGEHDINLSVIEVKIVNNLCSTLEHRLHTLRGLCPWFTQAIVGPSLTLDEVLHEYQGLEENTARTGVNEQIEHERRNV